MKKSRGSTKKDIVLVLHDIRSVINVGSIFRTAEGLGVQRVILSGYTPGPLDRFDRIRSDFHKAALGAETQLAWERIETIEKVLEKVRLEKRSLFVLEQNEKSIDMSTLCSEQKTGPLALVVGNETEGVAKEYLDNADLIIEIPMVGKKESFNVASATAMALYVLFSQNLS